VYSCSGVTWSHDPACGIPLTCESTSRDRVTLLRFVQVHLQPVGAIVICCLLFAVACCCEIKIDMCVCYVVPNSFSYL